MPVQPTYPGVYIEEIPSGVRTITGVATSITAFIGRAQRGPTDRPVTINSFGDFERIFGGLWIKSRLGFAVRDFYLNGGSQAIVVRLYHPESSPPEPQKGELDANGLALEAAYPGEWGKYLRARIDHDVSEDVAESFGLEADDLFNLRVRDVRAGIEEQFRNVTVEESPRQVDRVLRDQSRLVRVKGDLPGSRPTPHADPGPGEDVWADRPPTSPPTSPPSPPLSSKVSNSPSDGGDLDNGDFTGEGKETNKEGLFALEKADLFNILCIPPYTSTDDVETDVVGAAAKYCEDRRAMLLVDPRSDWTDKDAAKGGASNPSSNLGTNSKNAAVFFPRLRQANPLHDNQLEDFVPCGAVAGVFARIDAQRGVWKAPAGLETTLVGVRGLSVPLTDDENGELNPLGVNCLRTMPAAGPVAWGSRTLQGNDRLASEWKYIPVRRTALFIEESLYRGTQWVVFEPNDEPLWAQIRLNVGAFMQNLFRQGAFQGRTPQEAYLVKCDKETTTQNDINLGIVNIIVGFAPLKPAEFVFIKIQQLAGQIQT